ncbi:hypothetical protein KC343_g13648 [Hortaea werneckii]|uniref:PPPDE domain-containing protein n=1 Tax=Hortaea werneckii TaxID=91943 RepID=A0A3M7FLL4_HORWE|nr:hypothetical protein KC323_g1350 [Hortaea werneckii]KAI7248687.1 hypothetical protein KC352_g13310 [Hortaea werneckii]KAI7357697.1 hypothetical protein KC320_g1592 [Hortaea werneckii]KAI7563072.1 hypothetical protein KC317_g7982 [Hortaea werneckii]KAI7605740.1 hypothetical protein KC343_g13648 [Hortaea werneckii]
MILIYSNAHEPAPLLDNPLVEHNPHNEIRPVFMKIRKVRGKTGWFIRRYGHWFGGPKDDPEAVGHHAVQVGEYVYELTREEGLVGQRLTGPQVWPSTIKHAVVGWTDLSDVEMQEASLQSQNFVRSRNGGRYHIKTNNCQHFIRDLLERIITIPLTDLDASTPSNGSSSYCSSVTSSCNTSEKKTISIRDSFEMLATPELQLLRPPEPARLLAEKSVMRETVLPKAPEVGWPLGMHAGVRIAVAPVC